MLSKIKLDRVFLNVLLFIFYVLLVSLAFSFLFPLVLKSIWQEILDPNSLIFDYIQIWIFVLMFFLTIAFRKYCYFPIIRNNNISVIKSEVSKKINKDNVFSQNKDIDNNKSELELDIKIGKEIK